MDKRSAHFIKLLLLCVIAAGLNCLFVNFVIQQVYIPLYLDTVILAAVTFAAGLIPGLVTTLIFFIVIGIWNGAIGPFVLCVITEVLLISWLKPVEPALTSKKHAAPDTAIAAFAGVLARLALLYIVCCIVISVMGGIIEFIIHDVGAVDKMYYSAEDTFKMGLFRSNLPALAINIIARIQVNIVDRFIVIFGGYFISRGIRKLLAYPPPV